MQKTKFSKFVDLFFETINPIISASWSKRSILLLSLLAGFYFTNSFISFLLDKAVNTIFIAILILIIMELAIRSYLIFYHSKFSIIKMAINNLRVGSTYALILEAFKLGS